MSYLIPAVLVAVGVAAILFGGADDSPGLQGLGLLVVIGAVVLAVRAKRRDPAR